jgi:hypothetical protein
MRPDPRDRSTDGDVERIIYLGDVRRRRAGHKRQAPDRQYLAVLALAAVVAWAVWVTVVVSLQPSRLLSYLGFFVPFGVALSLTAGIGMYLVEERLGHAAALGAALRRGALVAGVVVVNAAFQAGHAWSVAVLGGSVLLALVAEAAATRRQM